MTLRHCDKTKPKTHGGIFEKGEGDETSPPARGRRGWHLRAPSGRRSPSVALLLRLSYKMTRQRGATPRPWFFSFAGCRRCSSWSRTARSATATGRARRARGHTHRDPFLSARRLSVSCALCSCVVRVFQLVTHSFSPRSPNKKRAWHKNPRRSREHPLPEGILSPLLESMASSPRCPVNLPC